MSLCHLHRCSLRARGYCWWGHFFQGSKVTSASHHSTCHWRYVLEDCKALGWYTNTVLLKVIHALNRVTSFTTKSFHHMILFRNRVQWVITMIMFFSLQKVVPCQADATSHMKDCNSVYWGSLSCSVYHKRFTLYSSCVQEVAIWSITSSQSTVNRTAFPHTHFCCTQNCSSETADVMSCFKTN